MKEELVATLSHLIRDKGYASLSIADIADATHLSKSSLYHHFPGGKIEMAQAVMELALETLKKQFNACLNEPMTPSKQLRAVLDILDDFYESGSKNCLVDVMSVAPTDPVIQKYLDHILAALLHVFSSILQNKGCDKKTANKEAITIVTLLQGSLVLARASLDPRYFQQTLKRILQDYA